MIVDFETIWVKPELDFLAMAWEKALAASQEEPILLYTLTINRNQIDLDNTIEHLALVNEV